MKQGKVVYCSNCPREQSRKRKRSTKDASRSRSRSNFSDDNDDDDIPQPGALKPDITFFGEKLDESFFRRFQQQDQKLVDLVIVIGTSLKVSPVSEIPTAVPPNIPQLYIGRELVKHVEFDVTMLGDCDDVVQELANRAAWPLECKGLQRKELDISEVQPAVWKIRPKVDVASSDAPATEPEQSPEPERV